MRLVATFFLLGLSFGMGPCLASCGPLIISYIAGTRSGVKEALWAYALFTIARIMVYAALGAGMFYAGEVLVRGLFTEWQGVVSMAAGVCLVIVGLLIAAEREIPTPWCRALERRLAGKGAHSVLALGLIAAILPCAPLFSVFSYIALAGGGLLYSLLLAVAFGLGSSCSPLLAGAALAGSVAKVTKASVSAKRFVRFACGMVLAFLGIALIRKGG